MSETNDTRNALAKAKTKAEHKKRGYISFFVIWFIVAAVIAVPAFSAGASISVAVITGLAVGFVTTGIGKIIDHFS